MIWPPNFKKLKRFAFGTTQQYNFLIDLAALLEDGVPVNQAIETLVQIKDSMSVSVANAILTKMAEGRSLADSMRGWFPRHVMELIRLGEQSGDLAPRVYAAAEMLSMRRIWWMSLLQATVYPTVVISAGLFVLIFIDHTILTVFASIKSIDQWPTEGKELHYFAHFIEQWWWMIPIVLVGGVFLSQKVLQDYIGEGRKYFDRLPIVSLYRKLIAARFMETLGVLVNSGMVFKNALKIMQYDANPYLASHVLIMEYRLGGGRESMADVLDTGLIDKSNIIRLKVVARGRGLDHALIRMGKQGLRDCERLIQIFCRSLGFILMLLGALLAIFMIVGMYGVGTWVSQY